MLSVSRKSTQITHPKTEELLVEDFMQLQTGDHRLAGYDAVFFIAGISSVGCAKDKYFDISRTIPIHFAEIMPEKEKMTFFYLSGAGTNAHGKLEWQQVKGGTENLLFEMPLKRAFGFRPAFMKPHKEQVNRRGFQIASRLLYPFFRLINQANTMKEVTAAMIACTQNGYSNHYIEVGDIKKITMNIPRN